MPSCIQLVDDPPISLHCDNYHLINCGCHGNKYQNPKWQPVMLHIILGLVDKVTLLKFFFSKMTQKCRKLYNPNRHSNLCSLKTGRFSPGHTPTYRDPPPGSYWQYNCKIDVGPGDEHASNNLFCKTTGREDGPLKEDWGRELRKLTDRQL